jgi:hypothetical protein
VSKQLTVTVDGVTFCDRDIPDDWAFTLSTEGAAGAVLVKAEPPRVNLLDQLGQAAANSSRRQTERKRAQPDAAADLHPVPEATELA